MSRAKKATPDVRSALIAAGVRNLRKFGYPNCTADNILMDDIYSAFFKSMLEGSKGMGHDDVIDAMIAEIGVQP